VAGIGLEYAEDDPHGRGLARAVGADESEHRALGDRERQSIERDHVAIAARQILQHERARVVFHAMPLPCREASYTLAV
jgi:hypothetical protein